MKPHSDMKSSIHALHFIMLSIGQIEPTQWKKIGKNMHVVLDVVFIIQIFNAIECVCVCECESVFREDDNIS